MEKFKEVSTVAAYIDRKNIDTDAIIPKQYLKAVTRDGFGDNLFDDWRYLEPGNLGDNHSLRKKNPEFFLNNSKFKGAKILVAGDNFGCGSSREHAVWALMDFGFRVVISSSFADIFYNNCFKNGLLPIVLTEQQVSELFDELYREQGYQLTVDLSEQTVVTAGGRSYVFEIDKFRKQCLLQGLDEIGLTLKQAPAIKRYEEQRAALHPWVFGAIK